MLSSAGIMSNSAHRSESAAAINAHRSQLAGSAPLRQGSEMRNAVPLCPGLVLLRARIWP